MMPNAAKAPPPEESVLAANSGTILPQAKRSRSFANKVIVRTILLAFAATVAWQWYVKESYSRTLAALDAEIDAMRTSVATEKAEFEREAREKGVTVTSKDSYLAVRERMKYRKASEISQFIYGIPFRTVSEQNTIAGPMLREKYVWGGLFKSYELYLNYETGDDPRLVTVDSKQE